MGSWVGGALGQGGGVGWKGQGSSFLSPHVHHFCATITASNCMSIIWKLMTKQITYPLHKNIYIESCRLRQCNTWPSLSVATVSLFQQVIIELSHTIIADTFIAEQQMVWLHVYRKA